MSFRHKVVAGECISSIAFKYGFAPATLWEHADNAELKRLRRNPNVLDAGDEVVIPDLRQKTLARATGSVHRFRRVGVPEKLRIRFLDVAGKPRAGVRWRATIGPVVQSGQTDDAGWLMIWIPPDSMSGELVVDPDGKPQTRRLNLGRLQPIETSPGVLARLKNLGFYSGPVAADLATAAGALRRFQSAEELTVTGEADEGTRARLLERHGS